MKICKLILPIIIVVGVIFGYRYYKQLDKETVKNNIKVIQKYINSAGRLVDYESAIDVKSINDIRLYVTEKKVKIKYGKILLVWDYDDFMSEEYTRDLEIIGIVREIDEVTKELRVWYRGEELERWAS